jgi:phage shock protein A
VRDMREEVGEIALVLAEALISSRHMQKEFDRICERNDELESQIESMNRREDIIEGRVAKARESHMRECMHDLQSQVDTLSKQGKKYDALANKFERLAVKHDQLKKKYEALKAAQDGEGTSARDKDSKNRR